jgi:hypothetical protein
VIVGIWSIAIGAVFATAYVVGRALIRRITHRPAVQHLDPTERHAAGRAAMRRLIRLEFLVVLAGGVAASAIAIATQGWAAGVLAALLLLIGGGGSWAFRPASGRGGLFT